MNRIDAQYGTHTHPEGVSETRKVIIGNRASHRGRQVVVTIFPENFAIKL